jgi:uncharacterized protein (DUF488 family)
VTVYTIGHSTRPAAEFIATLQSFGIELLADIRTIPRSRHNPQYDQTELRKLLAAAHIEYLHLAGLGGLRHAKKDSVNTAWKNQSFRGYADYMQTPEFSGAVQNLISLATNQRTAIMCSEAVPWRCHRSLVGDALLVHGVEVEDIMAEGASKPHKLTPWAKVHGEQITYPADTEPEA